MIYESVDGERFATVAPTPRLEGCIAVAVETLRSAAPGAKVEVGRSLDLGSGTMLIPTIAVYVGGRGDGGAPPDLVVELRVESTSRYVLGPKRLGYSRHGAPELWFVDPWRRRVAVLVAVGGGEIGYRWPPSERRLGERLESAALDRAPTVDDLLAGWPADVGREPEPGERWWEEA